MHDVLCRRWSMAGRNLASRITARKLAAELALKMLLKRSARMHLDTSCYCFQLDIYPCMFPIYAYLCMHA